MPDTAGTGPAKLIAACGSQRLTGSLSVVAGPKRPGVTVTKSGYSQRYRTTGSTVSYGVVLTNASAERDARDVIVLVNFVDATDTVLGTAQTLIEGIVGGAPYYLGGDIRLPSTAVARLELTVRSARVRRARSTSRPSPRAKFSAVFLDVSGTVVGGSSGRLREALPHGISEFFEAGSGADSMLMARAVSAQVSVEPNYVITG